MPRVSKLEKFFGGFSAHAMAVHEMIFHLSVQNGPAALAAQSVAAWYRVHNIRGLKDMDWSGREMIVGSASSNNSVMAIAMTFMGTRDIAHKKGLPLVYSSPYECQSNCPENLPIIKI
ncbi:MAG TPA: hypothetical protein VG941_01065 [Candidatus Paceibacterota bacterium]|nr:hypothetical protein [Candidatus Paceibacterota bacterium]